MAGVVYGGVSQFILTIVCLSVLLLHAAIRSRLRLSLGIVGALAVGYVVLIVSYVFPSIDQAASPRKATEEIKALALDAPPALFMYIPGWPKNEDAVYYLKRDTVIPDLPTEDAVIQAARTQGTIRMITEEQHAVVLEGRSDLVTERIRSFDSRAVSICSYCLCAVTCEQDPSSRRGFGRPSSIHRSHLRCGMPSSRCLPRQYQLDTSSPSDAAKVIRIIYMTEHHNRHAVESPGHRSTTDSREKTCLTMVWEQTCICPTISIDRPACCPTPRNSQRRSAACQVAPTIVVLVRQQ